MFINVHKQFLSPGHVAMQATEAEEKLQNSYYDGERKGWNWAEYVVPHKEQHTIMESLTDYGCSGMDNGTKVCHFLQGIKSSEFEAVVNVVWAQPEKYGSDFDKIVSYLGQMVTKKGTSMQSFCIAKIGSQLARHKVVAFTGKVECKKYSKAVWNSINKELQMKSISCMNNKASSLLQSRLVQRLELKFLRHSLTSVLNPRRMMSRKRRERLLKNQHREETKGILWWLTRHWVQSARNPADFYDHQKGN